MEILNRSLRAIRGMSDDPLVPYQQEALDMSHEDKEGDGNYSLFYKVTTKRLA